MLQRLKTCAGRIALLLPMLLVPSIALADPVSILTTVAAYVAQAYPAYATWAYAFMVAVSPVGAAVHRRRCARRLAPALEEGGR